MAVTAVGLIKPCLEKISDAASGRKFAILRHEAKVSKHVAIQSHDDHVPNGGAENNLLLCRACSMALRRPSTRKRLCKVRSYVVKAQGRKTSSFQQNAPSTCICCALFSCVWHGNLH